MDCEPVDQENYIKDRFKRLFNDSEINDCAFEVGPLKNIIKGQKVLFATASPVFQAMFRGELKDDSTPIKIEDLKADGFEGMKQFIYTDQVDFTSCLHALSVYVTGRKFLLQDLCTKCVEHIKEHIMSEMEVINIYEISKLNQISEIENICLDLLQQETSKIINSEQFLSASIETVETILKMDPLNVKSELDFFGYVEKWTAAEAARRGFSVQEIASDLNCIIKHIRFLTMSSTEYATGPGKSPLLTTEEKLAIVHNIIEYGATNYPSHLSDSRCRRKFNPPSHSFRKFEVKININKHFQNPIIPNSQDLTCFGQVLRIQIHKYSDIYFFILSKVGEDKLKEGEFKCYCFKVEAKIEVFAEKPMAKNYSHEVGLYLRFYPSKYHYPADRYREAPFTIQEGYIAVIPCRYLFSKEKSCDENVEVVFKLKIIDVRAS